MFITVIEYTFYIFLIFTNTFSVAAFTDNNNLTSFNHIPPKTFAAFLQILFAVYLIFIFTF